MTDLKNALWCDLTTDAERSAWLLLGRGYETGVVAKSMQNDLARAYQRLAQQACSRCGKVNPAEIHTCTPLDPLLEALRVPDYSKAGFASPQREWQGLTENEKELLWDEAVDGREHFCSQYGDFADTIDAKLKEKNCE